MRVPLEAFCLVPIPLAAVVHAPLGGQLLLPWGGTPIPLLSLMLPIATLGLDGRAVINTPTLRERREARERRARIIGQLHAQANATSNHVLAQHKVIEAHLRGIVLWRRAKFILIGIGFMVFGLACLLALAAKIVIAL
jgi:hypothetical protein